MLAKYGKNIKIGKNNYISSSVVMHDNVVIGDNNKIYDDVIIFPNTTIGDNNKIFPRNMFGEVCPTTDEKYQHYDFNLFKGVHIGNNNLFHVENCILAGIYEKTTIGDNNKFLGRVYVGHDANIKNNITFYPNIWVGGHSVFLDHSNIGMGSLINQRVVIGNYSMISSSSIIAKHCFPYYININNKIHRLNDKKNPENLLEYEQFFREINSNINKKNYCIEKYNLPDNILNNINEYIKNIILVSTYH